MFCSHCRIIVHNVSNYKWLHPTVEEHVVGTKHHEVEAPKKGKKQWVERRRDGYNGTSVAGASIAEMKIINVENLMEQEDAIAIEHQHTKYKKHTHAATEQHDTPENIVETKKEQHTHATNEQHVATVNINENEIVTEGALTK